MGLFAPIRNYIETLVHPSAQQDVLTAARHRAFIAPRLLGSIVALASFPVYLLVRGAPSAVELLVFAWLVAPILTAYFLSRTGRYESAHVLSSLALTGLVTAVAAATGGIASFAAIWLVVVPLEAALSASRRVVATASTFALAAAGLLVLLGAQHLLPPPGDERARRARRVRHRFGGALRNRAWRSAPRRWRAPASGCFTPRRTAIGFWRATSPTSSRGTAAMARCCSFRRPPKACSVARVGRLARPWPVRSRPCRRSSGLSDCARRCGGASGEPRSVEFRVRRDSVDADGQPTAEFVWIEMRCRPLEQTSGESSGETAAKSSRYCAT